jgi:peptide/nickel transport system ATP-binding protein
VLRKLQMVFQDPDSTLNPTHSVRTILERSLKRLTSLDATQREERLRSLMRAVQLDQGLLGARPAQLSGGQKQRVAIARAFAADPELVLCDEPVSSLDVSVQAAILNLLDTLQRSQSVSYLFISHDIDVVRYLADHVGVMYGGRLVEVGAADAVFAPPHHPYTRLLLSATAAPESAAQPDPAGCVFHTRCPLAIDGLCNVQAPPWQTSEAGAQIRCHVPVAQL